VSLQFGHACNPIKVIQMIARENFKLWFSGPIRKLAKEDPHAGFILEMVCFPLLERYLRQKTKAGPKQRPFRDELRVILPELTTDEVAQTFWDAFRNGALHLASINEPSHGLSHATGILAFKDERVWLNPILFALKVIETIENDFDTYADEAMPLPEVTKWYGTAPQPSPAGPYVGTTMPYSTGTKGSS
jgi:hypothetical protein